MNTMQDQPAPTPDLTPEQLSELVQQAANAVTQHLRLSARNRQINNTTRIDKIQQEQLALVTLMHLHIDALTKLLVAKGLLSFDDVNKALVAEFATHANELAGKPQLVVPRR